MPLNGKKTTIYKKQGSNETMNTVLLVDDDKSWLVCLEDYLNVFAGYVKVLSAANGEQAMQIVKSNKIDLVMTDLRMPKVDGFELLSHLNTQHPEVAVIIASALDESEVSKRLNNNGHYQYLQKPIKLKKLANEIIKTLKEDSRGFVHGFTLANFLQLVEMEKKTCTLMVKAKGKVGYLYIENGELIDAETNRHTGPKAAVRIINWESADTQIQRFRKKERTIDEPIMRLLLKATSRSDKDGATVTLENMLEEAIVHAEGLHFNKAMGLLARLLKKNPRSHTGWLWFSRISEDMKSIRNGLRNAAKLAPKDPEINEDNKKLKLVEKKLDDGWVQRCPICWCPILAGTLQCDYCGAHLRIHPPLFEAAKIDKMYLLNRAAERYLRVIASEKNAAAHSHLATIYLHHKNWEEALHHLDTAVKLAPDNQFYSEQLSVLLDHMAAGVEEKQPTETQAVKALDNGTAQKGAENRRILVVESSPITRKVISVTMGQRGFDVLEAGDGLEALSKMHESRPKLVLLDVVLPKMDGYKVLEVIKESPDLKDIPVIILTRKDGFINKVKGKTSGCVAYLTKPFDPSTLADTVEKHIESRH